MVLWGAEVLLLLLGAVWPLPKDAVSCPSLNQGFHRHCGPLRGPVCLLLLSFPCSPAFPGGQMFFVLPLSALRFR